MKKTLLLKLAAAFMTAVMAFSAAGCVTAVDVDKLPGIPADETFTFQVLFTSDLHGCFNDWSYSTNGNFTGLARIAVKINELRDENTILIDVGDSIQGNGTSVFHTATWDAAEENPGLYPVVWGFEYLDYDVWVLGNHEFNFGVNRLEKAYGKGTDAEFQGAVLAGNIFDADGNQPYDSYYIKTFDNGFRVAVIGMTHPNIVNWDAGNLNGVYTTESASLMTQQTIEYLKSPESEAVNGKIDLFIAAQHMSDRREHGEGSGAEDVIAVNGDDLALFIGAHGHMNQNKMVDGVRYVELGANGGRMGQVEITATKTANGWAVSDKENDVVMTNIALSQYSDNQNFVAPNEGYKEALADADAFAKGYATEVIGELTGGPLVPAPEIKGTYEGYLQDTALVHLINDAMLYYANQHVLNDPELAAKGMEVTLSGTAPLDTNANAQPGDITRGGVSTIYKYDNNTLCILEMTGAQFKAWMEWGYVYIGPFNGTGYDGFEYGPAMVEGDLTIPYGNGNMPGYNMDQFAGLNYQVDLTKPYGERIVNMTNPDGSAFDLDKTYWVAVNNYRTDTQLTIHATQSDRPAVFPADGELEPATIIAREIDVTLIADGVAKDNGEGMLGVMVDYIDRVKGGTITNEFVSNWNYILPDIDPEMRALAVEYVNDGLIDITVNNGYSRRAVTVDEVMDIFNSQSADNPAAGG